MVSVLVHLSNNRPSAGLTPVLSLLAHSGRLAGLASLWRAGLVCLRCLAIEVLSEYISVAQPVSIEPASWLSMAGELSAL